ncbi:MAG: hypothetical protein RIS22_1096 [Actinomycetota bacterium]|jgi:methylated-DNA-[protein]-cysteine S-methyltransferase
MKPLAQLKVATPIGSLYLITDEQVLLAAGFSSFSALHQKLSNTDQTRKVITDSKGRWITALIDEYFDGDINAFNTLEVRQPGSAFSQRAWRAMRKIPAGKVISYADLAMRAGSPAAVRAAGSACGRNAIAPIIPCHRIIRSDGSLGNYGYGIGKKSWLLRHEGVIE